MNEKMTEFPARVDAVVERVYASYVASAAKRGRNPQFPYVPVVKFAESKGNGEAHTRNPSQGLAYATREEAIARAQAAIESYKTNLRRRLLTPHCRALREWHGLPRELPQEVAR